MKYLLRMSLILFPVFCFCQKSKEKRLEKYVDSIIAAQDKAKLYELHEFVSLPVIEGAEEGKYWNYYYRDCNKKDVFKVSISRPGLPEELCYYFENNKVIKRELYKFINGQPELIWAIYYANDKEVLHKGKNSTKVGYDLLEEANYFLTLAIEYLGETGCR